MRNRILTIITGLIVTIVTIIACEKKQDIVNRPGYSEFSTTNVTAKFFIKNDPNAQLKIPIGITNISNVDRKIIIKDSSRKAVAGTQYSIESTTITIPAGKAADSIVLKGIYAGYPIGRIDTLYLKIVGGDVPANAYNTMYTVIMQGYCDVVPADLVGDFTHSTDVDKNSGSASTHNPYTVNVSNWTATSATSATVIIKNLGATPDIGFGPFLSGDQAAIGLTANLDWSNPSNFSVTIPSQNYVTDLYGDGQSKIKATGTFSSCAQTFTITFTISVAVGTYNPVITTLKL